MTADVVSIDRPRVEPQHPLVTALLTFAEHAWDANDLNIEQSRTVAEGLAPGHAGRVADLAQLLATANDVANGHFDPLFGTDRKAMTEAARLRDEALFAAQLVASNVIAERRAS